MKIKPRRKNGGVLVELSPKEAQFPPESETGMPLAVFHLKEILVPVDFSSCSKKALLYAIPFAKQFYSRITLVHVAPYAIQPPEAILAEAQTTDAERKALDDLVHEISNSVKVQTIVRAGNPATEIVELAKESQTDLIVLSTNGRSGLAHVILGSTAEKVVRHAPCPVLVVREKEHEFINDCSESFNPAI